MDQRRYTGQATPWINGDTQYRPLHGSTEIHRTDHSMDQRRYTVQATSWINGDTQTHSRGHTGTFQSSVNGVFIIVMACVHVLCNVTIAIYLYQLYHLIAFHHI